MKSDDEMTNGERFEKEVALLSNSYLKEKTNKEFDINGFLDAVEFTFKGIFDFKIGNRLEAYCRFIKDMKKVGDHKIHSGLQIYEIQKFAEENKIDYDFGICYYKYEYLDKKYYLQTFQNRYIGLDKYNENFQFYETKTCINILV